MNPDRRRRDGMKNNRDLYRINQPRTGANSFSSTVVQQSRHYRLIKEQERRLPSRHSPHHSTGCGRHPSGLRVNRELCRRRGSCRYPRCSQTLRQVRLNSTEQLATKQRNNRLHVILLFLLCKKIKFLLWQQAKTGVACDQ